jgi:hypothetical protein
MFAAVLIQVMSNVDVKHQNIIELCRGEISGKIAAEEMKIVTLKNAIGLLEDAAARFINKGSGGLISDICKSQIDSFNKSIQTTENNIELYHEVMQMFHDYEYRIDLESDKPNVDPIYDPIVELINGMKRDNEQFSSFGRNPFNKQRTY